MKTMVIDGVKYEEIEDLGDFSSQNGDITLYLRPLPPKQKTIVQVAAERAGDTEEYLKGCLPFIHNLIFEAIDERFEDLTKRIEGLENK